MAIVTCVVGPALFNHTIRYIDVPSSQSANDDTVADVIIDQHSLPENWEIRTIEVRSRSVHELPIRSLHLSYDLLFVSIIRGEERIIPRGHTKLELFDIVQVMGTPNDLAGLTSQLHDGKTNS